MTDSEKQTRLDRLNDRTRDCPRGQVSKAHIAAQWKIDRYCSSRFAAAAAAGRILRSEEEMLTFASLPKELMGQADFGDIHDAATLSAFLQASEK